MASLPVWGRTLKNSGVTLLELLIVLAMLGIFFAIGAVTLPRDKFAVSQAAKGLARDFQAARFEAISRNWFVGLHLDPATNSYLIYCDNPVNGTIGNIITDCRDPDFDPFDKASNKQYDAGSDVVLKTVTLSNDYGSLVKLVPANYSATVFDPRGNVYNAVNKTIQLSNARGGYVQKVILSQQGRARIE